MMRRAMRFLLALTALTVSACQTLPRTKPPADQIATSLEQSEVSPEARDVNRSVQPPIAAAVQASPLQVPALAAPMEIGADVFARLRSRFADVPCVEDRVVQRWEKTYAAWPPRLRENLARILPLMALVVEEVELHHLPGELALLPIVESWYQPAAGTPRSAYGMWQFTTGTARHFGLKIAAGYDERLAPQASTRAAMLYLSTLLNRFGDWRLASMAFNAGEYRILRALAKSPLGDARATAAQHRPAGLSMTTYEHLAKIQALACLIAEPARFGLDLPDDARFEPLVRIAVSAEVSALDEVALLAQTSTTTVRNLNPEYLQGRVAAHPPGAVLLPRSAAHALAQAQMRRPSARRAFKDGTQPPIRTYRVVSGDTLGAVAQRHAIHLSALLRWNRLDLRDVIRPGQLLRLEP